MGEDHHAVFERCVAGRNRMWFSDNLNQADPATANWFQSIVMTECGNIDAQTSAGVQDGAALLKLAGLVVYPRLDHASNRMSEGYD